MADPSSSQGADMDVDMDVGMDMNADVSAYQFASAELPSSVPKLLALAELALVRSEAAFALRALQQALQLEPDNAGVLDLLGHAYLEAGEAEQAMVVYRKSCELSPTSGSERWLNLAQLVRGKESVHCYDMGFRVLENELAAAKMGNDESKAFAVAMQMADVLASMADLYTTDLCDEPNAESECERLLQMAVGTCAKSASAFQSLVNLRLIQQRVEDAERYLDHCVKLIRAAPQFVDFETRLNAAKACVELNHPDVAAELCEDLLRESDQFPQVWYVAAMSYFRMSDAATAKQYLEQFVRSVQASPVAPEPGLFEAAVEFGKELGVDVQALMASAPSSSSSAAPAASAMEIDDS